MGALIILLQADRTSQDEDAFDIRAVTAGGTSSYDHVWHVVPRNSGDHKLDLKVAAIARIDSGGDFEGEPVELARSVSVACVDNLLNEPVSRSSAAWPLWVCSPALIGLSCAMLARQLVAAEPGRDILASGIRPYQPHCARLARLN